MNINDTVITKKTGFPASGVVIGLIRSDYYMFQAKSNKDRFARWNNLYPDWDEKSIAYVFFEEPMRPVTFDEYVYGMPEEKRQYIEENHLDVRTLYEADIQPCKVIAYPVDDLEIL